MTNFDLDIQRIANEMLEDGTIEGIFREKLEKAFADSFQSAFSWGSLKKTIETRITEVMVPFVEKYDFGNYIVKMEAILTEIINNSALVDNKKILENFKRLMMEPEKETITLRELHNKYMEYVSRNVDTSDLEVIHEDGPSYQWVECQAYVELEEDKGWSNFRHGFIDFGVSDLEEQEEDLNHQLRLSRWKHSSKEGYEIRMDTQMQVGDLRMMDEFEIYLLTLARANVRVVGIDDGDHEDDSIEPANTPECEWY